MGAMRGLSDLCNKPPGTPRWHDVLGGCLRYPVSTWHKKVFRAAGTGPTMPAAKRLGPPAAGMVCLLL
jgi:hypothetical protein